jgi:hypothetical protein
VTSDSTTAACTEGDLIKFTATVTLTGYAAVDTTPYTFAWFDGTTDLVISATETTAPLSQAVIYTCASVRDHAISVKVTGPYTADAAPTATTITVNNAPALITTTVANYGFLSSVLVGQEITLTVPFTDISPSDAHSLYVVWGDSQSNTISILDTDINGIAINSFTARHTFSTAAAAGPFDIKLTLRDGVSGGEAYLTLPTIVTLVVSE